MTQPVVGRKEYKTSMSVALGLGLGFFVATAVASVLAIGVLSGYQNTVTLLREKAELIVSSESYQAEQFLRAAERQIEYIAEQIETGDIVPAPDEEFTSLLSGTLAATPHIVGISFTNNKYLLIGARREEFETIPLFQSVRGDADLRTRLDAAREAGVAYWAAPLWREELSQGLLNVHLTVTVDSDVVGVLTALVSTKQLSNSIADLETDFGANAFILYGEDMVLAHPLLAFGYGQLTRLTPFPRLALFNDPVISSIWDERKSNFLERIEEDMLAGPGVRFVRLGGFNYVVLFRELEGFADKPLFVGTYLPHRAILSEVERLKVAIILCVGISVLSALTASWLGRRIAKPVQRLASSAGKVSELDLEHVERVPGSFFKELNDTATIFNRMLDGLAWFERYVPKKLVRQLLHVYHEEGVRSEHREIVVMFTDVLGFTTLSETMTAPETANWLNAHFALIAAAVDAEDGTIDKYIGDSVMAVWGVPEALDDPADRACRAALAIRNSLERDNRMRVLHGQRPIHIRIGIHQGPVVAGNIGSPGRIDYTVIGDAVNVAQRVMEMNKSLCDPNEQVNILVSDRVWSSLREPLDGIDLGVQHLRGRREPIGVHTLGGPMATTVAVSAAMGASR